MKTITVEIWSDVMCPFCYIGKRQFDAAMTVFPHRGHVEVIWKSFQLNPSLETDPSKSLVDSLMESKGWSYAQVQDSLAHVSQMAAAVGLAFNFDKAVVANSFDAHRFTHVAKGLGLQHEAEERLFLAYFCDGENTADIDTLTRIGSDIGLDPASLNAALRADDYAEAVRHDIYEAKQIGVNGVPFFVFNNRYGLSGARGTDTFIDVLNQLWAEADE
jgi:predicted DsbA family dithiol-disulfide isomerase